MLDNTLTITYDSASVDLTRVNQDNYASDYYGESGDDKITLNIAHTVPERGGSGESHLIRLDVEHYDAEGVYQRTSSAWTVLKTFNGPQASSESVLAADGLVSVLSITDLLGKVIARES